MYNKKEMNQSGVFPPIKSLRRGSNFVPPRPRYKSSHGKRQGSLSSHRPPSIITKRKSTSTIAPPTKVLSFLSSSLSFQQQQSPKNKKTAMSLSIWWLWLIIFIIFVLLLSVIIYFLTKHE